MKYTIIYQSGFAIIDNMTQTWFYYFPKDIVEIKKDEIKIHFDYEKFIIGEIDIIPTHEELKELYPEYCI